MSNTKENNIIVDTDKMIQFIQSKFKEEGRTEVTKDVISKVLDLEIDYLDTLGLIGD